MIIPIRDLKDTSAVSKLCHESEEPIYVTKNGYADMVIMSNEAYEKMNCLKVEEPLATYSVAKKAMYTIPQIKQVLDPIFKSHGVKSAILFGSYAKGTENEKSDIDLLVDSGLKGLSFFGLLEDVASALKVPVDLIDKYEIKADSKIEKEIAETGIRIYG